MFNRYNVLCVLKCYLGLFLELLEFSEDRNSWESVEQTLIEIR